jgi:hypothetical protein
MISFACKSAGILLVVLLRFKQRVRNPIDYIALRYYIYELIRGGR